MDSSPPCHVTAEVNPARAFPAEESDCRTFSRGKNIITTYPRIQKALVVLCLPRRPWQLTSSLPAIAPIANQWQFAAVCGSTVPSRRWLSLCWRFAGPPVKLIDPKAETTPKTPAIPIMIGSAATMAMRKEPK
jgi:hypothetical protein